MKQLVSLALGCLGGNESLPELLQFFRDDKNHEFDLGQRLVTWQRNSMCNDVKTKGMKYRPQTSYRLEQMTSMDVPVYTIPLPS